MEDTRAIQNTLNRMDMVSHSFVVETFDVLEDIYRARHILFPDLRKITSLKVALTARPGEPEDMQIFWLSALSDVLISFEMGRKLESLELEITDFDDAPLVFFGEELSFQFFVSLERFTSLTIPHDILAPFLSRQTNLQILNVGDEICERQCPLNLPLLNGLGSIRCAASCVSSIVSGKPVYHARIIDRARSRKDQASFLHVFVALRMSLTQITRLEMTFPSTDMDILRSVVLTAPQVVHLTLIEIEDVAAPKRSARRPWNHLKGWASDLKAFRRLSYFKLETAEFVLPKKSLPDVWYPKPRSFLGVPESIEVWHRDIRSGVDVRHLWSLGDDDINLAYVYVILEGTGIED